MRILKAGLTYFLRVFGAGFALALLRIPFLVPTFGTRTAELMEMPVMLAVIAWVSHRLVRDHPQLTRLHWLGVGLLALACMLAAELAVAYLLGARSPSEYIAGRDPVSGSVYLASLILLSVAPTFWSRRPRPQPSSKPASLARPRARR